MTTTDHDLAALAFDTGGTVFDWHSAVHQAFERQGELRGIEADWSAVTKTWRRLSTGMVGAGLSGPEGHADMNMDGVLERTLESTLEQREVAGFSVHDRRELVRSWRQVRPWPDVTRGLPLLRERFIVCPFTILTTALVVEASRRAGLTWDAVFSCEMIGIYKTDHRTYETVARWLDLPPQRIMLVSTHNNDIGAARACGMQTAFVYRPDEWWDIPSPDSEPGEDAQIVATDFVDLARQLGGIPA